MENHEKVGSQDGAMDTQHEPEGNGGKDCRQKFIDSENGSTGHQDPDPDGDASIDPPKSYVEHVKDLSSLAGTIILSEIFQNTLVLMDIAFVGRLPGKEPLAAAGLATLWFNIWNTSMLGFCSAIDTLLAQSYGANEKETFAKWTGTSIVIVFVSTIVISGFIAACEPAMVLLGQDPDISRAAGEFSYRLIPGLFPYYGFKVLVKYLQTQDKIIPGVVIGIIANGFNFLGNWLFIFKLGYGLNGAPWATTITRFIEFFFIVAYLFIQKSTFKSAGIWPIVSIESMGIKKLRAFGRLAIPGALSMVAEAWSFEITTVLAGLMGTTELDAHVVTLSIATFIYMSFPFAIGLAASIRTGHLVGGGRWRDAIRSCVVATTSSILIQALLIAFLVPLRSYLSDAFVNDEEVASVTEELILLSSIFMLGDSVQACIGGVLRGLGRQNFVFFLNVIGFWVLAVPIGALLAFPGNQSVHGLWMGMSIGIYTSACIGVAILRKIDWKREVSKAQTRISLENAIEIESP
jgi:MATE family multidrug resistance protein